MGPSPLLTYNTELQQYKREDMWNTLLSVVEQIFSRVSTAIERMVSSGMYDHVLDKLDAIKQLIPTHTMDMLQIMRRARAASKDLLCLGSLYRFASEVSSTIFL